MPLINRIEEMVREQGCKNPYEFWRRARGLSQAAAYRLYRDKKIYPSKKTQEIICEAFNVQPGDFLCYFSERKNTNRDRTWKR